MINITNMIVYAIWTLDSTPAEFYHIWGDIKDPLHLSLPLIAMILGILTGRQYGTRTDRVTFDDNNHGLRMIAMLGIVPLLLSVTVVAGGTFYRPQGLFYTYLNRTNIRSVEWISNDTLQFRIYYYRFSDCIGCSPTPYCDYEIDIASNETEDLSCGDIEIGLAGGIQPGDPMFVPSKAEPLVSPDGSTAAYVMRRFDIYVRPTDGGFVLGRRVYRFSSSGFLSRNHMELAWALIFSLPIGLLLMAPWAYVNKDIRWIRRVSTLVGLWNLVFFVGSITHVWGLISLHHYLWAGIP